MMLAKTTMEMTVRSSSLESVFLDVAVLNPLDAKSFKGPIVIKFDKKQIYLPKITSPRVKTGEICLNSEQRRFLGIQPEKHVTVQEIESLEYLQTLKKVTLVVHSKFFEMPVPNDLIGPLLDKFHKTFEGHVMNCGHYIPMKSKSGIVDFELKELHSASDKPLNSGVFSQETVIKTIISTT